MAKKSRQAHIPKQAVARRKARRPAPAATPAPVAGRTQPEPVFADEPVFVAPSAQSGPVDTRPGRRVEALRRSQAPAASGSRAAVGQLPSFDHGYLMGEIRRIGVITVGLLGLIVALAVVMR